MISSNPSIQPDPSAIISIDDLLRPIQANRQTFSAEVGQPLHSSTAQRYSEPARVPTDLDPINNKQITAVSPRHSLTASPMQLRRISSQIKEEELETLKAFLSTIDCPCPIPKSLQDKYPIRLQINIEKLLTWEEIFANKIEEYSDSVKTQQLAIMELITTELTYILQLREIISIYVAILINIKTSQSLPQLHLVCEDDIFINIGTVYQSHVAFYNEVLLEPYERCKMYRTLINPSVMRDGFSKIRDFFQSYLTFCTNVKHATDLIREAEATNPIFNYYLNWCRSKTIHSREDLKSLLSKPHQRITKYPLILSRIIKHTTDKSQLLHLEYMLKSTKSFIEEINAKKEFYEVHHELCQFAASFEEDKFFSNGLKLPLVMDKSVVASLQNQNWIFSVPHLGPGSCRRILHSLLVRFRELSNTKLVDSQLYVFTDLVWFTSVTRKSSEKRRSLASPIRYDKLHVVKLTDGGSQTALLMSFNDFCRLQAAYVVSSDQNDWVEKIVTSKTIYISVTGLPDVYLDLVSHQEPIKPAKHADLPTNTNNLYTSLRSSQSSLCRSRIEEQIEEPDSGQVEVSSPRSARLPSETSRRFNSAHINRCQSESQSSFSSSSFHSTVNCRRPNGGSYIHKFKDGIRQLQDTRRSSSADSPTEMLP